MRALILALAMLATPAFGQELSKEEITRLEELQGLFQKKSTNDMREALWSHCTMKFSGSRSRTEKCVYRGTLDGGVLMEQAALNDTNYEIIFDFCIPEAGGNIELATICYFEGRDAFENITATSEDAAAYGMTADKLDHCWRMRPDFVSAARCARIAARRDGVTLNGN